MKRSLIKTDPRSFPAEFFPLIDGIDIYDSSSSPEASVYFIDKDAGYYLKKAARGALYKENILTRYFYEKKLSAEVLSYISGDSDWLLTRRLKGEDCTHRPYLDNPKRLCDTVAELLRELHSIKASDCPIKNHTGAYVDTVKKNYGRGIFDPSFLPESLKGISAKEAFGIALDGLAHFDCNTLLHGDYCLPNILLDSFTFSGFIDLGNGGLGDRHIDLFWGAWTLNFNLGTDRYRERFFDAYGRDKIEKDAILCVGCAECFG